MKLDKTQISVVEEEFETEAIAQDHPAMERLESVFGSHTFFLDGSGLSIVEPHADGNDAKGTVLRLAKWSEDQVKLEPHDPEVLSVTVNLRRVGSDPGK